MIAPWLRLWQTQLTLSSSQITVFLHKLNNILLLTGLYLSDFHWEGSRVSTGYDWPSDYSGHGGCQIGKRRIVVHKYTGLARKWNRGVLRGLESTPKRFCRTFWGVSYLVRGSNPLNPPSNTALSPITVFLHKLNNTLLLKYRYQHEHLAQSFTITAPYHFPFPLDSHVRNGNRKFPFAIIYQRKLSKNK